MTRPLALLGLAALALFLILAVMSFTALQADGSGPFDSKLFGYDAEPARAYLLALTDQQSALYLGPFRWLDTLFPTLLALFCAGAIRAGRTPGKTALNLVFLLPVLTYLVLDLWENAQVATLIRLAADAPDEMIEKASLITTFKWGAVLVSLILAGVGLRRAHA